MSFLRQRVLSGYALGYHAGTYIERTIAMFQMSRKNLLVPVAALISTLLVTSCAIYKPEYQQGSVLNQSMVDQIKPGMTRSQVQYVLGTPSIVDPFHDDRWVYYYSHGKIARIKEQRQMTVYFDGELVRQVEGNVVTESDATQQISQPLEVTVDSDPVRKLRKKKSLFDRLGDKITRDTPPATDDN